MAAQCDPNWQGAAWAFYRYQPSLAAAVLFCVIFSISTLGHLWQMCKSRTWFFTAFVVGCVFETIGYGSRAVSASEEPGCWTLIPFILQTIFVLIAPALFAASIYIILGRIVRVTEGTRHAVIPARWISTTFVVGDVACFSLQSGGISLYAIAREDQGLANIGHYIVIAGLALQLSWFLLFTTVALIFHLRMRRRPTDKAMRPEVRWETYLYTLYSVSALIVIRSIFRLIEYIEGNDGYLMRHEAFFYVFDALPMYLVALWIHWQHPGEIGALLNGQTPLVNGFKLTLRGR